MDDAERPQHKTLDLIVVGAGFAGLYALHKFRGMGMAVRVLEAGSGVGGVWFWNRYPGARCDVESIDYSYSFSPELEQDWTWTERYATQPELRAYLDHVADRFDLRRDIQLETRVIAARFDERAARWTVTTEQGETFAAPYLVMATGPLSMPIEPQIPGLAGFDGEIYYSNRWPDEKIDFSGKRVGLIGTGSSGIQATPIIAAEADHLTVFQRTPNYSVPARNGPLPAERTAEVKARYPELRDAARNSGFGNSWSAFFTNTRDALQMTQEERDSEYEQYWQRGGAGFLVSFHDLMTNPAVNETAGDFVRRKIRSIVKDPVTAARLTPPESQAIGCKRICVDGGYFETFNRDNVSLVDLRETPIDTVTATGIRTSDVEHPLDALVLATGFDAMTGALGRIDIRGRGGRALRDKWDHGPINYLGMMVKDFPNLFIVNGPGSPSVTANLVLTSELQADFIAGLIGEAKKRGAAAIGAQELAEQHWAKLVNDIASRTIFTAGCNSWFVGANIPGKPRLFTAFAGGLNTYIGLCRDIEAKGYEGFDFEAADARTMRGDAAVAGA